MTAAPPGLHRKETETIGTSRTVEGFVSQKAEAGRRYSSFFRRTAFQKFLINNSRSGSAIP
jgi:hypothetical protein